MMIGLLFFLTAAVWLCSYIYCSANNQTPSGRTQSFVQASVLSQTLVIATTYALGSLHILHVWTVVGVIVFSMVTLVALARLQYDSHDSFQSHLHRIWLDLVDTPIALVRSARTGGFLLWPVLLFFFGVYGWFAFAALVSPPLGNNDALFYHEPIVGLTIQHASLGPFDLPAHLQRINGMPRFCHLTQMWFALFTGRDHVELANWLSHPVAIFATYGVLRHVGVSKGPAIAWSLCWSLTPGLVRLTPGIMVDVQTASLTLAAAYCVWVPQTTTRNVIIASLACALTLGTKYHVIPISFVLVMTLWLRLWAERNDERHRSVFGKIFLCAAIAWVGFSATYLRNWIYFDNPIWPAGLKLPYFGEIWRSPHDIKDALSSGKGLGVIGILDKWTASPYTQRPWQGASARPEDYGIAGIFWIWPAALLGCLRIFGHAVGRIRRRESWSPEDTTLVSLAFSLLIAWGSFPSIVRGRYWLVVYGFAFVVTAWLLRAPHRQMFGRQMAFLTSLCMMVSSVWMLRADHWPTPSDVWARLQVPSAHRDFTRRQLSSIVEETGKYRAEHMTAGTRIGFDTGYSIGLLWNDDYSNEVVWLRSSNPIREAEGKGLDFLYLDRKTFQSFKHPSDGWKDVGPVLRRRKRPPGRLFSRIEPNPAAAASQEPTTE